MASPNVEERSRHRIGRYLVTGRIGKGGMGMVYRGRDEALDREVAVKTLTIEGSLDADNRRRFEVEARAAAKLQHPNIVTVHELGEDRGVPYIAMELLPGADLETVLRSGEELLLLEKLDIVVQICRGLAYAHEHGVVHRDIKPSNIRLLDDGALKIMDFGIAKLGETHVTRTGMMVGTVHYMSPEQARGKPLDGRTDVFAVGVILYELLAGQKPFRGEGPTDILYKIVHESPEPLDAAGLGLDPRLAEVAARALDKDPDRRYPTAAALAEELLGVMDAVRRSVPTPKVPLDDARRLLKEGRVEEGLSRLRGLARDAPSSVDVRRALRAATRETALREVERTGDTFPELDATYRAAQTSRPADTQLPPPTIALEAPATKVLMEPPVKERSSLALLAVPAVLLLVGLGLGFLLLRGRGESPLAPASPSPLVVSTPLAAVPGGPPSAAPPARESMRPAAARILLPVITDPPGASVSLDGQPVAGVTPLDAPLAAGQDHLLTVALEGWAAQEVKLLADRSPQELRLRLEPRGPLATVTVQSSYPLDVTWRGRALARGEASPRVQVPGGRQVLALQAPSVFLRGEIVVSAAPGGTATVDAPALGRLSIRANPDNCQISIDGTFVDYPPILDKPVVVGAHAVSFKWPDGKEAKEAVEVQAGKMAFVTGRKE